MLYNIKREVEFKINSTSLFFEISNTIKLILNAYIC